MEIVRSNDPGTLQYDTFSKEDASECIVLARFRDVDALLQHGANTGGDLMEPIVATEECFGELLGAVPRGAEGEPGGWAVQVVLPYLAL